MTALLLMVVSGLLCLGQVLPPAPVAAPEKLKASDTVLFRNGDLLYGSLHSIDPIESILWQHPDALQPIEFQPEAISEIQFGSREQPKFNSTNACQIRLTNQDELEGNLVLGDSEKIVLETWYAGRIEIPRKLVQFITPQLQEGSLLFAGPESLEGWTMGQITGAVANAGDWKFRGGAFFASRSASVARDLKLPDQAKIEFDLTWKGMLNMAIALYTDYLQPVPLLSKESGPDFGGFYSLQLNNYTANLLPITKNDPIRYLGQAPVQAFSQKNKLHVDIRINKPKRIITLLIDGVLIKQWIDTEEFVGKGTAVRFVHQGQGAIKLSGLRVSEWNGQFEEKPVPTPNTREDLAKLQNGDRVVGRLQAIQDGKVTFAPAGGTPLEIPMGRVKLLEMAALNAERPAEDRVDTRVKFWTGGSLGLRLEKWSEREVIGVSPNLGRISINPLAFGRVHFNLKAPPKPAASVPARDFQRGKAVVRAVRGSADYQVDKLNWRKLRVGQVLPSGSTVRTGPDSQVDLFLGDNGPVVRLTPESILGLAKLNFRRDGFEVTIETLLNLEQGRILANVRRLSSESKYEVHTPKGMAALRTGDVEADADQDK